MRLDHLLSKEYCGETHRTVEIELTDSLADQIIGALAQLGERLICIQEVIGSIPVSSTKFLLFENWEIG